MSQRKLTKRADGRFKVNYGGKQFYGKTMTEARQKRDAYADAENQGLNNDFSEMTFDEYGLNWVSVYRCECTVPLQKQYAGMVKFVAEQLHGKLLRNITATDMQGIANLLSVYSTSYVSKFFSVIRSIFKTAAAEGAILKDPMPLVKRPKCKKTEGHRALEPWERELIVSTCSEHDFGLAAMTMLFAGVRRGEMLYLDIDRDVDFERKTITVRGAVSFAEGNQPEVSDGKTAAAKRTVPLFKPLADALRGHHGLICPKADGGLMSQSAFDRKFESYRTFLETKVNGCHRRWYGKTKEHKALLAQGGTLPEWKDVTIRCHDFRVDFCTRSYYAHIPLKTLQSWMGHSDTDMILSIYSKLTREQEESDALKMAAYMEANTPGYGKAGNDSGDPSVEIPTARVEARVGAADACAGNSCMSRECLQGITDSADGIPLASVDATDACADSGCMSRECLQAFAVSADGISLMDSMSDAAGATEAVCAAAAEKVKAFAETNPLPKVEPFCSGPAASAVS